MDLVTETVQTPDGWRLRLRRAVGAGPTGPPVLFVPGYGMNGWVFHNHPSGPSFAEVLLDAGLDPWAVDLRGTSTSRRRRGAPRARLGAQATRDLPAVLDHIRAVTGAERVHAIGCSLGGSLLYAHGATDDHRLDRLVGIGAPLHWGETLQRRVLGRVLPVVGAVPVRGSRGLARMALPVLGRAAPGALGIYLNAAITPPSAHLASTVENPLPSINRAIAAWMRDGDLRIEGRVVREGLARFDRPLLVLHGSGDGIVPEEAALSVVGATAGPVHAERVEHPTGAPVGHADLFVMDVAAERVFRPVASFLTA